jgi:hypothetical protein
MGRIGAGITTLTLEPAWIVTVEESDFVGSAKETAVTFTVGGFGTVVGAINTPPLEIHPYTDAPPLIPLTRQRTAWLVVPATLAENCWVAPLEIVRVFGEMVTPLTVGGGLTGGELEEPPQAAMDRIRAASRMRMARRAPERLLAEKRPGEKKYFAAIARIPFLRSQRSYPAAKEISTWRPDSCAGTPARTAATNLAYFLGMGTGSVCFGLAG